ncbi:SpoIIE family protein phosphatase [Streptomyces cathayae]|uniref:SpoIIE family protein phosphatase n=1 Tax=Streptomyces cathayae TaxID=3031124 RepID=A0ABY8JWS0_9ACTN|nr:SpoIIE family protein phosphatase [Streptomyces sp. HUAS 5]WGD38768.1 SpoIIE family protein phosphatase [Streptomyces sp. HUAS 5]
MTTPRIDYRGLFAVTPSPYLVLDPDLVVVDVNQAYLRITGRTREEMIGRHLFEVHPDNPADPDADGVRNLNASLQRVLRTKEPDTMAVQKYDVPVSGHPGVFQEKWWSPVNTPLLGPDGQVEWLLHRVEDMTEFILTRPLRSEPEDPESEHRALESELYIRAQELQRLNEELRNAHARERHIALTLQEAMLHSPDLAAHREIAVRYLPAARSLNVCGDWYDVVDLSEDTYTVAVGDVVGHGLEAAAVMGMLRSALSAAVRAIHAPGAAMDVLSRYAGTFESALATTAVKAVIDTRRQHITYTSAGHPPPALSRTDGTVVLLDQATEPPLGVPVGRHPRAQATVPYTPGDTLVLYTDGLTERRGEDIDAGLQRLTDVLVRHARLSPDRLADVLLTRLGVADGRDDDVALIVIRL